MDQESDGAARSFVEYFVDASSALIGVGIGTMVGTPIEGAYAGAAAGSTVKSVAGDLAQ